VEALQYLLKFEPLPVRQVFPFPEDFKLFRSVSFGFGLGIDVSAFDDFDLHGTVLPGAQIYISAMMVSRLGLDNTMPMQVIGGLHGQATEPVKLNVKLYRFGLTVKKKKW
jgi:hypothetical protein